VATSQLTLKIELYSVNIIVLSGREELGLKTQTLGLE